MAEERKGELENIAEIETLGTDMGTGGSYCSNCKVDLTRYVREMHKPIMDALQKKGEPPKMRCPGCDYSLKWGSVTPYPFGGSDF